MRYLAIHILDDAMVAALYSLSFAVAVIFCGISFSADDTDGLSEYVIGPGDVISVSVWQYEQFNTTATVGPDGKITVNLLGDISIAGLTRDEAEKDIGDRLTKFVKGETEITVSIVQFNSRRISVFGQVANPVTITFTSTPSLIEAIMVRSVPTPNADLTAIKIIPADASVRKPVTVNLAAVLAEGDASKLPELHPGDTIYVPRVETEGSETVAEETTVTTPHVLGDAGTTTPSQPSTAERRKGQFVVHVMGAVGHPSSIVSDKELTITEALLQAGSATNGMALKYVRVIRGASAGGDRVVYVDLDEYLTKGDASLLPKLYSGDTIYVPDITQEKTKEVSIFITGEVLRPGSYNTREPMDVLDAISMAGGLTPNADPERIRIRKEDDDSYQEKIVNIDESLEDVGSTSVSEMVGPGCRIYVPTRHRAASAVAVATRGVVAFLADVALVFSIWRVIGD